MAKQKYLSLSFVPTEDNGQEQENTLTVRFSAGGFEGLAHFHGEGASLTASGDALFCLGLVPAMELGVDLRIEADVDRELMENAAVIQDRLCSWYPGYRPVRVEAETTQRTYPANRGTGLFYSGGVDSSFSLATESDRITGLVTIIGFGVESVDAKRAERLKKINREVASKYGMKSIAVTTDIPLAARCLAAGAQAVSPTGKPFTDDNIGSALAMRELMGHLRDTGEVRGGGPAFGPKDRSRFLGALEEAVRAAGR